MKKEKLRIKMTEGLRGGHPERRETRAGTRSRQKEHKKQSLDIRQRENSKVKNRGG